MSKNAFVAFVACALVFVLAGCTSGSCCGSCDPCSAPDPCSPCATACDPCGGGGGRPAGMPDEAKEGEAWCRVLIPAKYEEVEKQVCVCPASCEREWIPPVYEEQERQVCCKPASCRKINIPAEYETKTERVMTCPARTVWKKIPCESGDLADGEKQGDCWQLTEIPAQYKEVTKRICVKEASCTTETIPPEYKTVTEKVVVKPGEWKTTPVPAQYKTVTERKLVEPCRWEWRRNESCEVPGAADEAPAASEDGDGAADAAESTSMDEGLGAPPAGTVEK